MDHIILDIDDHSEAVRDFFTRLGDQPVLVKSGGQAVAVVYPAMQFPSLGEADMTLEELAGAWDDLPDEVDQIGR